MFEKLVIYRKVIELFKKQNGIVVGGFPVETFHDYYVFYGNLGMLGFFLKFIQGHKFIIANSNKQLVVLEDGKIIYNQEVAIDPYDIVSRHWYGILVCCAFLEKRL